MLEIQTHVGSFRFEAFVSSGIVIRLKNENRFTQAQ
jgi:hypothetical protein